MDVSASRLVAVTARALLGSAWVLVLGVGPGAGGLWAVVGAKGWLSCWC